MTTVKLFIEILTISSKQKLWKYSLFLKNGRSKKMFEKLKINQLFPACIFENYATAKELEIDLWIKLNKYIYYKNIVLSKT